MSSKEPKPPPRYLKPEEVIHLGAKSDQQARNIKTNKKIIREHELGDNEFIAAIKTKDIKKVVELAKANETHACFITEFINYANKIASCDNKPYNCIQKVIDEMFSHYLDEERNLSCLKLLVNIGVDDINKLNRSRRSAIMLAALRKDLDLVEALYEKGANILPVSEQQPSALYYALSSGDNTDVVEFLLSKDNSEVKKNPELLYRAIDFSDVDAVRLLVNAGANVNKPYNNNSPLGEAINYEKDAIIDYLLNEAGVIINLQTERGLTALMAAASRDNSKYLTSLINIHRADIKGRSGGLALNIAAYNCNVKNINLLLDAEAKINYKHKINGYTALMRACETKCENGAVIKLLIARGADRDLTNNEKNTALSLYLTGHFNESITKLLITKDNINMKNENGETPLMIATYSNQISIIELLLKNGANKKLTNNQGNTALLIYISRDGNTYAGIIELLLTKDNINIQNNDGNTVLSYYIKSKSIIDPNVIELLINKGADPNLRNNRNESALTIFDAKRKLSFYITANARNIDKILKLLRK